MDIVIGITKLSIQCIIGCYPEERQQPQPLFIDVQMHIRLEKCGDDVQSTVDYALVARLIQDVAVQGAFFLLETLARHIGEAICRTFPAVQNVWIRIEKPQALPQAACAFVEYSYDMDTSNRRS